MEKVYCCNCKYRVFDHYWCVSFESKELSNKCKHPNFYKEIKVDTPQEQKVKIVYGNINFNKNNDCKYYEESNYIYYDGSLYKKNGYLHNCIKQGKDPGKIGEAWAFFLVYLAYFIILGGIILFCYLNT